MPDPDYTPNLVSALGELLPQAVTYTACRIPKDYRFEFQEEADGLMSAGDYRKREFTAGRSCLRAALEQIGFSRRPLLPDSHGAPALPDGAVASISHSRGYCAAIAAKNTEYRMLGMDLEMTNRLSASAIGRTVHPDEEVYAQGDQKKASLLFCAKEAFFKAQFPEWHTHANFHDLVLAVDEVAGSMSIQLMGKRFPEELRVLLEDIEFSFRFFGDYVVTACWLKA